MKRGGYIARKTPLKRAWIKRRPRKAKPGDDRPRLRWATTLPCASCNWPPPSHPHHPRTGVGKGQKAPDADAFPLCESDPRTGRLGCHDAFHDRKQRFWGWDKERAGDWEREQTAKYRALYAARAA